MNTKWTQFYDLHSGGSRKLKWEKIYIEASVQEAKVIFENRFDENPDEVACSCCGQNYSISESDSLEAATACHRGCAFDNNGFIEKWNGRSFDIYLTLNEYRGEKDVLILEKKDIKDSERL